MNRPKHLLFPLVLSVGLTLVCLWMLDGDVVTVDASPARCTTCAPGDVITVCLSGGCPYTSVQAAVDAASGGEIVKVAAGIYDNVHQRNAITQVVHITKSIAIRGGYTTTNGFADPPDPSAHPTTLDAQELGRVVYITGSTGVKLTGLQVTGGRGGLAPEEGGGGIFAINASVTISNCQIYSNTARYGGGIQLRHSAHSALLNNEVYNNTAEFSAGIYLRHSPTSTLTGNVVHHNEADWGGGVYLSRSGNVTLTHNHICSNTVTSGGGGAFINFSDDVRWTDNQIYSNTAGIGYNGGGIQFKDSSGALLTGNEIYRNTAEYGGGLYLDSGSLRAALTDNRIYRNKVIGTGGFSSGGGIHIGGDNATLSGNDIFDNESDSDGGGITIDYCDSIILDGNDIYSNNASDWGGGLYLNGVDTTTLTHNRLFDNVGERGGGIGLHNAQNVALEATQIYSNPAAYGGGLYLDGSHVTMTNAMLTHNSAISGGAGVQLTNATAHLLHATLARNLGQRGFYLENGAAAWLTNTILVSHTTGIEANGASTATLASTLWGAGAWANVTDTAEVAGGTVITAADLRGDPAFAAPDAGDYHITRESAAVDAGVDAEVDVDIDGDVRPLGNGYDVGADEYACLARLNAGTVHTTVQAAIDASSDVTDVVQVAGTCYEHDVIIDKTLTLQGGWSADFATHDPKAHTSTLDAQGKGRVLCIAAGSPVVEDLHVVNGSLASDDGAGVYVGPAAAAPTLRNNRLYFNTTDSQGHGGAVCVDDSAAVTLEGNQIYSNSSGLSGGAVYVDSDDALLVGNHIFGNATKDVDGGGIAIGIYSAATLERNTITANSAHRNAGGLSVGYGTDVTLINNIIADNACCASHWAVGGAGIWLDSGDHVLLHNTFADNHGGDGAAIRLSGDAVLTNTIIASHTVGIVITGTGSATLDGTLWHNNDQDYSGPGTIVTGTVDLHGDPAFVQPGADNHHLRDGSPAIDAGVRSDVGEDIDGETRPRGLTYDIGADEYPDPVVAPAGALISGPDTGQIDTPYVFTATVSPTNSTLPSYIWVPTPQSGQGTAHTTYVWSTEGTKSLSVTVSNSGGSVEAQTTVDIQASIVPPAGVSISGPDTGLVGTEYTFTATVAPITTTSPSYIWGPAPQSGQGTAHAVYLWTDAGDKSITVTVSNSAGTVAGVAAVRIEAYVYLPLVLRQV